jgi:hypothetical protein
MNRTITAHRKVFLSLLAALALRAVIPIGYMPGSLGGELLFEMCPDGMPSAMVQALGGEHHHHGDDASTDANPEQCPTGHMLTSVALNSSLEVAAEPPHAIVFTDLPIHVAFVAAPVAYLSRAPPVFT